MPWGVRWIGYCLPLTYFINISQGVMLRGAPISTLWVSFVVLIGDGRRGASASPCCGSAAIWPRTSDRPTPTGPAEAAA